MISIQPEWEWNNIVCAKHNVLSAIEMGMETVLTPPELPPGWEGGVAGLEWEQK